MRTLLLAYLLAHSAIFAFGQTTSPDLYLVNLSYKDEKIIFSKPVNITNHEGYDNQPEFSADGKRILYVSMPDTLQTDIFEYIIADSTTKQLTLTEESEYSPRFSPLRDQISFIRVDVDKGQRLYQTSLEFTEPEPILSVLDSVAYYTWLNDSIVALAFLNNGMELIIYELNTGQYVTLDKGIGRCVMKVPGADDLVYTKKSGNKVSLFRYAPGADAATPFCEGLDDVEDYTFTPDGKLLAGQNGKLMLCRPAIDSSWSEIADFTESAGLFYRLAVSPDGKRMALVTYKGKRP